MDSLSCNVTSNSAIGARVKTIRGNLTQEAFADAVGINNEKAISKIENGHQSLSLEQAYYIAQYAGITMEELFSGKKRENNRALAFEKLEQISNLIIEIKKSLV